jgi:hypothetical protein
MATIASAANGNWSAGATWTGGAVPGNTDTAKIDHVVTLDANAYVGGIDPTGVGVVVGTSPSLRILVGASGRPQFLLKAVVV